MESIREYVERRGITATTAPADSNPSPGMDDSDLPPRAAHDRPGHFRVTLECDGRSETFAYTVGVGILDRWALDNARAGHVRTRGVIVSVSDFKAASAFGSRPTIHNVRILDAVRGWARDKFEADPADLLNCLHADAAGVLDSLGFEEWAESLGYDTDSRKAESIYRLCVEEVRKVERLLGGRAALESFLYEVESE